MKYVVKNNSCGEIYPDKYYECKHEYELYAEILLPSDLELLYEFSYAFPDAVKYNSKEETLLDYVKNNLALVKRLYSYLYTANEGMQDGIPGKHWQTCKVLEYEEPVFKNLSDMVQQDDSVCQEIDITEPVEIPEDIQQIFDKYGFDPQRCFRLGKPGNKWNFVDAVTHIQYDSEHNIVEEWSDDKWDYYGASKGIINGVKTWFCFMSGHGMLP
jgi:hypothetical protein